MKSATFEYEVYQKENHPEIVVEEAGVDEILPYNYEDLTEEQKMEL